MAEFKLNHLHFKTPDPKKTAQWYVDNLGATIVSEIGDRGFRLDLHGIPLNVTTLIEGQPIEQFYGLEHVAIDTSDFPSTVEQGQAAPRSWASSRWATAATSASSRASRACG